MITVYHTRHEALTRDQQVSIAFDAQPEVVEDAWNTGGYEPVAQVDSDNLEVAWELTNNIHSSWSMDPDRRVTVLAPLHVIDGETYGRRSSMVGDVFVVNGTAHVVATCGFDILPHVKGE